MTKGQSADPGKFNFTESLSSVGFGIVVFIFFAFFYDHHLLFIEQLQLFLLTWDHFLERLSLPGGLNGWTGGFLTQFYYYPVAGALIIAILLVTIQLLTNSVIKRFRNGKNLFPLTFVPALVSGFTLCNELYPLSVATGMVYALAVTILYIRIRNPRTRFASGIILIPVSCYLIGGAYITIVLIITAYEIIKIKHSGLELSGTASAGKPGCSRMKSWACFAYPIIAVSIPLIVRQFIIFQPVRQAYLSEFYYNIPDKIPPVIPVIFVIPFLLTIISVLFSGRFLKSKYSTLFQIIIVLASAYYGRAKWTDPEAEEIMTYDHLAKHQRWDDLIEFAEKKPPRNFLSLAMLNLSLAKKGQLGDKMFSYDQHGPDGLFLRFEKEFISPMMGNEIFYHIGLINASHQYAFESMEVMPNMEKTVRSIKRLAETNLINGHYNVSEKYLKLLEKTLFYRSWAKETKDYLYDEEMINNHPDWGEKRKLSVKKDFFFHIKDIESVLHRLLKENPGNKIALEYLAAYYLLKREPEAFANLLPAMERMKYRELPLSWQEAFILYNLVTNIDPLAGSFYSISQNVRMKMESYAKEYLNTADAQKILSQFYSGTYWYYFHYSE